MSDVYDKEASNLAFVLTFNEERKPVDGPISVVFRFDDIRDNPLAIEASYHGVHKNEKDLWLLDTTPRRVSIVATGSATEIDPIDKVAEHVDRGGKVELDEVITIVHEPQLTLPTNHIRTSYWLGHVTGILFMMEGNWQA